jgi:hypothetical protein
MKTSDQLVVDGVPNWPAFAQAYKAAGTEREKDELFLAMCEWCEADPDPADGADVVSTVHDFLRQHGAEE